MDRETVDSTRADEPPRTTTARRRTGSDGHDGGATDTGGASLVTGHSTRSPGGG